MVELAQPDFYVGSEPRMQIVNVPGDGGTGSTGEITIFNTTIPYIWRIRALTATGGSGGFGGTFQLALEAFIGAAAGTPWTNSNNASAISASSPQAISAGDDWAAAWSTEIGDNYLGLSANYGKTAVLGFPMLWLPAHTRIGITWKGSGGFNDQVTTRDGYMLIEYLLFGSGGVGGDEFALYLQPRSG